MLEGGKCCCISVMKITKCPPYFLQPTRCDIVYDSSNAMVPQLERASLILRMMAATSNI